jgi:hypothetical protein
MCNLSFLCQILVRIVILCEFSGGTRKLLRPMRLRPENLPVTLSS